MFTGQLGVAQFGTFVFGVAGVDATPSPVVSGRAENTDTSSQAEAVAVVFKLT